MDVLQIDPVVFLGEVAGLFVWICLAAAVYAAAEKALGGPAEQEKATKM
jgi:hypothetical protein